MAGFIGVFSDGKQCTVIGTPDDSENSELIWKYKLKLETSEPSVDFAYDMSYIQSILSGFQVDCVLHAEGYDIAMLSVPATKLKFLVKNVCRHTRILTLGLNKAYNYQNYVARRKKKLLSFRKKPKPDIAEK